MPIQALTSKRPITFETNTRLYHPYINHINNSASSSTFQQQYASKLKKANYTRNNSYECVNNSNNSNNTGVINNSLQLANTTNSFNNDFNFNETNHSNDLNEFQASLFFNPTNGIFDVTSPPDEILEIKSHKFILASRSGKFRELLKTNILKLKSSSSTTTPTCCCVCSCISTPNSSILNETAACSSSLGTSSSDYYSPSGNLQYSPCTSTTAGSSSSSSSLSPSSIPSSTCSFHNRNYCECGAAKLSINDNCSYLSGTSNLNDSDSTDINDLLIIETNRSPKVIEYLIRYMYTGYLDTLDIYAKDIYEISKEYKVHGLTNLSREYIIKELNIQNCCDYLVFCVVNNDYELNNKIQSFITENYDTIVKTNAYKQAKRKYRELFENTFNEISKKNTHF